MGQFKKIGITYDEQVMNSFCWADRAYEISDSEPNLDVKRLGDCNSLGQEELNEIDLLIAVGNDETILKVAVLAAKENTPILGIHAWNSIPEKKSAVLMELGWDEAEIMLKYYLGGKIPTRQYPLLRVRMDDNNEYKDVLSAVYTCKTIDISTLHMSNSEFSGYKCRFLSVEVALSHAYSQGETLDYPIPREYSYEFIRTDTYKEEQHSGKISATDFKAKAVFSGGDVQGKLVVDKHLTELVWHGTKEVELCTSPLSVKLLSRRSYRK